MAKKIQLKDKFGNDRYPFTIPECVVDSNGNSLPENLDSIYVKPSGGIPKSDLDSSVQESLRKADSALQSYTEQYKGTVTGVKVNGATKSPSNGIVDLGTVITAHQDISGKVDKESGKQLSTNDYTTTEKNKLAGIADGAEVNVQSDWAATSGDAFIKNKPSLASVATSGSYNDLTNKPTIPAAVSESTVSGWGFTKNAGTITGIKMNGASKGTSGIVDLGTVITSHQSLAGYATQTWVSQQISSAITSALNTAV